MPDRLESTTTPPGCVCVSVVAAAVLSAALPAAVTGQTRNDLLSGFRTVPHEAQPRVWWH